MLITGAASGIGRAVALAFAREGARLFCVDVNVSEVEQVAKQIGGKAQRCDVGIEADVSGAVEQCVKSYGSLDVAVNAAGIDQDAVPFERSELATLERVMRVNVFGMWSCMRSELRVMLERGSGAIVNVASIAGLVGAPAMQAYVASKHAVVGLTRSAALDCASRGVRVNALCPGGTRTPMLAHHFKGVPELEEIAAKSHPLGRLSEPDEQARAALFLASDEASFITGQALAVDGGYTVH